jgi:hypothetical protein
MQFPPSDHIVWKIIRQLIIGVVFCVMSAVAGFDIAKTKATE